MYTRNSRRVLSSWRAYRPTTVMPITNTNDSTTRFRAEKKKQIKSRLPKTIIKNIYFFKDSLSKKPIMSFPPSSSNMLTPLLHYRSIAYTPKCTLIFSIYAYISKDKYFQKLLGVRCVCCFLFGSLNVFFFFWKEKVTYENFSVFLAMRRCRRCRNVKYTSQIFGGFVKRYIQTALSICPLQK